MNNPIQKIDIVIPVYNEELNLKILLPKIINIIKKIKKFNIRIICIDDNSSDQTLIYLKLLIIYFIFKISLDLILCTLFDKIS